MIPGRSKTQPIRPVQDTPEEIITDILGVIRGQFYPDADAKTWGQQVGFIRRHVVLWPASWLNGKGVSLPPDRYKGLILGVLMDIKRHGNTGAVKFWPGYMKHCLQEHFKHHGDEIYDEAKSIRTVLEQAMLAAKKAQGSKAPDPVELMAQAYRLSRHQGRPRPAAKPQTRQQELLPL